MEMLETINVKVCFLKDGPDGSAWYAWEKECPEEGYFYVGQTKPTAAELVAICPSYVEVP